MAVLWARLQPGAAAAAAGGGGGGGGGGGVKSSYFGTTTIKNFPGASPPNPHQGATAPWTPDAGGASPPQSPPEP